MSNKFSTEYFDFSLLGKKNLPEPLDSLNLDWPREVLYYITNTGFKLFKENLGNNRFEYRVRNLDGDVVFSIISSRNTFMEKKRSRKRRRNK